MASPSELNEEDLSLAVRSVTSPRLFYCKRSKVYSRSDTRNFRILIKHPSFLKNQPLRNYLTLSFIRIDELRIGRVQFASRILQKLAMTSVRARRNCLESIRSLFLQLITEDPLKQI